jgi:hypothetical protein
VFPVNVNYGLPLMSLSVSPRCVDLTAGPSGSTTPVPQSFNETRGVDMRLEGPDDLYLDRMTLNGLYISTPTATVGARVYGSGAQLLASANVGVTSGANQSVTVPITAYLAAGSTYRVCFFVNAGGSGGSGRMFDPDPPSVGGFPYVEGTGTIRVLAAYSTAADAFPTNANIFVPLMTLCVQSGLVDVPAPDAGNGRWEVSAVRPNPVVDSATLDFRLPERSRVVLEQFSVTGARVARKETVLDPGRHSLSVSSRSMREGVYFLRCNAYAPSGELRFTTSRKIAVLGH